MTMLQLLRFIPAFGIELLAAVIRWLAERPIRFLILALVVLSAWLWITGNAARDLAEHRRHQAFGWRMTFVRQKNEMFKLVALVRAARIEAARLDRENVERVQREWAINLSEVTHDYQADLAAARSAVDGRMRQASGSGATCDSRGGGAAGVFAIPALSTGALRPGEAAVVDRADIDAVTDNTLRLEYLIDAWKRAASIDVNRP